MSYSPVISLKDMAQCLSDAKMLLRDGDMCVSTYVELLEEAARQIRSVLAFAQDIGLEIIDEDVAEAYAIVDYLAIVHAHRKSASFQGGDYDLYYSLQDPWDIPCGEAREVSWERFQLDNSLWESSHGRNEPVVGYPADGENHSFGPGRGAPKWDLIPFDFSYPSRTRKGAL